METVWTKVWCGLTLRVESRAVDGNTGRALRVQSGDAAQEWLRFDCFERDPHWHLAPGGVNEIHPLDERGDVISGVFDRLRDDLAELLSRAGAPEASLEALPKRESAPYPDTVLEEAERAMRHRPARLDDLDPRRLEQRRSEKWHTYPRDVLPAWVAEMDFPVAAPIQSELARFAASSDVGYPLGVAETGLPDVFCQRMAERFDWHPTPDRVEILSEVVQGMHLALVAYTQPGQGVAVQTPIYPPFLGSVRDTGRRLVDNPMRVDGDRLEFDLDGLAAAIDPETRVLLFCNPHNPSGRVYAREELERVAEIAIANDLVVVSDEIHGDLLHDGRRHLPLATLGPEIARRTVTLTSASKAFNIPGLRCAVAHFGDPALQERFNTAVPRHVRGGLGLFGIYASMAAWRWSQPWLDEVLPYLADNRDFVQSALRERIPEIGFHHPEATYLAWLDCRALVGDDAGFGIKGSPAAHFLRQGRVALSEGRSFGSAWGGYARLNFATSRAILTEVIDRVAKSIGR